MPADTKLYLYLDPGGLVRGAPWAWDPQQFGGWVPHQMISYLWPSGPFYWLLDIIGVPDWVAHRLWIGTLFFLAGCGVLALARRLGLPTTGALVAAIVYQTTPFIVPYVSRTSLMLLPWAALGWITLAVLAAYRLGSWRWAAASALLIGTIGGVNGTAFLMIVPAPVLLVAWEWVHGRLTWRRVTAVTLRLSALAVAISLWWVVMLSLQGRYGAEVLSYSETLEGVSFTSTSSEVVRSMGYWLAYIRDPYAAATTAAMPYMSSVPLLIVSYALPLLCMLGLMFTRWRYRGYAALLFVTGLVLSVGFHPYEDPAPLFAPFRDSGLGLALRSSTRALPLLAMGLGLAAAALVTALVANRPRQGRLATTSLTLLALLNLPVLWRADYVDPALERDETPPAAWLDAAATLGDPTQRVLQLPGSEFGAFRWGYTVDPPLPGLMDASLVTRDLLPLGSAGVMDLLYALDNRAQAGSLDQRSIAPVARFLGAEHLWLSNDLAFDRFRTPRPERFADTLTADVDGLGPVRPYGAPTVNRPDIPIVDEDTLSDPLVGSPIAPVVLRSVSGAAPMIATAGRLVVLDGSGDGVVDAAAAGWITGTEPIVYANDLTEAELDGLDADTLVVVTDSNRDRTLQWRSSQDNVGMTESGGSGSDGLRPDPQNQRLPLFTNEDSDGQTVAAFDGASVQASAYGEAFAFLPEYRAAMAVDGDLDTAWLVGQRLPPIGETITISSVPDGQLRLVQAQDPLQRQMITAIEVSDAAGTTAHALDATSLTAPGHRISVSSEGPVTIRITEVGERPGAPRTGTFFVGFAELGPVSLEYVRPPTTMLRRAEPEQPLVLVFQRDRVRATNRWRADPEPSLRRRFDLAVPLTGQLVATVRLAARADDATLDALSGTSGPTADRRLVGVPGARGAAAFDGDPGTAWTSPFALGLGSSLLVEVVESPSSTVELLQPVDDLHSPITELTIRTARGDEAVIPVPTPDEAGSSLLQVPIDLAGEVTITVSGVAARDTVDRRYGDVVELPVSIRELTGLQVRRSSSDAPVCRDDLLQIDGRDVPLRIDHGALLRGEAVTATTCTGEPVELDAGQRQLTTRPGRYTGIDVDTVSIGTSGARTTAQGEARIAARAITRDSPTAWSAYLTPCPEGCWLLLRQGFNRGWTAAIAGEPLGEPRQLDGGINGWWVDPFDAALEVSMSFAPQRTLRLGLAVSALTALLCLALVAVPRRRSSDLATVPLPTLEVPWAASRPGRARLAAVGLVVAAPALIAPIWVLPALVAAGAVWWRRHARLSALAAWSGIGAFAAVIALRQLRNGFTANAGWPAIFAGYHRPMLFCCILLAVMAASADDDPVT